MSQGNHWAYTQHTLSLCHVYSLSFTYWSSCMFWQIPGVLVLQYTSFSPYFRCLEWFSFDALIVHSSIVRFSLGQCFLSHEFHSFLHQNRSRTFIYVSCWTSVVFLGRFAAVRNKPRTVPEGQGNTSWLILDTPRSKEERGGPQQHLIPSLMYALIVRINHIFTSTDACHT